MIVISAKNITKQYGTDVILEGVSFHIDKGDRIGIVGVNGAGKTTLLKILAEELPCDEGTFFTASQTTVGYLKQKDEMDGDSTVLEEAERIFEDLSVMEKEMETLPDQISQLSAKGKQEEAEKLLSRYSSMEEEFKNRGGYSYKSEIKGILGSMAFGQETYDKKISTLSGGERTRLSLACLLLQRPDILFLDEPTNHLDIGTLKWLEQYLKSYDGTIVVVSHDRYFLDQTVTRIFEIENHKLETYDGNYTLFAVKKREKREAMLKQYAKQQREIKKQEDMIRRFKERGTEKLAKRARSREKMLEHMERTEKPETFKNKMGLSFKENFQSGKDVILAEDLGKSFGRGEEKRRLFSEVSFDIKRGQRICIVGANGIGKTTLLKIIMGDEAPDEGYLKIGHNVDLGYYDQEQAMASGTNTVLEELRDAYGLYDDSELRGFLGRFLFKDDMVFLPVDSLSGGERARLALLKLMLSGANTLVLDEPTNHLDMESKEVFEDGIKDFPGTVIVVSHDRYFLSKIPDKILELDSDGIKSYLGTYEYYVEKKSSIASGKQYLAGLGEEQADGKVKEPKGEKPKAGTMEERRLKKEKEAEERRNKRILEQLEKDIKALEKDIGAMEEEMCKEENLHDHKKLADIDEKLAKARDELEHKYEQWIQTQ